MIRSTSVVLNGEDAFVEAIVPSGAYRPGLVSCKDVPLGHGAHAIMLNSL